MSDLIKITNSGPVIYSSEEFRREYPYIICGSYIPDNILNDRNVYRIVQTSKPSVPYTKTVVENFPVNQNGSWVQSWSVVDATQQEIEQRESELKSQINDHRETLIVDGCTVAIANVGTIYVTGTAQDVRNVDGLGQGALARIVSGDTTTVLTFRDGNNDLYDLTPPQMLELWQKSAGYISALYQASWVIKDMSPIPEDFTSNTAYWPSNSL